MNKELPSHEMLKSLAIGLDLDGEDLNSYSKLLSILQNKVRNHISDTKDRIMDILSFPDNNLNSKEKMNLSDVLANLGLNIDGADGVKVDTTKLESEITAQKIEPSLVVGKALKNPALTVPQKRVLFPDIMNNDELEEIINFLEENRLELLAIFK